MMCSFEVEFIFAKHSGDLDNRIKPLLDWIQRVGLVSNDKLCEKLTAMWGDAPAGVKVRLRPWLAMTT